MDIRPMDGEEKAVTTCILGLLVTIAFGFFCVRGCVENEDRTRAQTATECIKHHTPGECARVLRCSP